MMFWDVVVIASSVSLVGMSVWAWLLDSRNRKLRADVATLYKTNGILLSNLKESFATNEVLIERCVNLSIEMRGVRESLKARAAGAGAN